MRSVAHEVGVIAAASRRLSSLSLPSMSFASRELLQAGIFVSENRKALKGVMDREAAGKAKSSSAFIATAKWLEGYDCVSIFVKTNKKALSKVMAAEAAGAASTTPTFKSMTRWLKYYGNKWYLLYLA